MDLSVVTTLYRSSRHLREFHARTVRAAEQVTPDFEILYVNDGSPDDSLALAIELFEEDERVRIVDLARNYQHLKAMMTGLACARGDLVFLIDCDLEEEPEWLVPFHERMGATHADVVYGVQAARKGGLVERVTGQVFYRLVDWLSTASIPPNLVTARLMTKGYVDGLVQHRDRELYLGGLFAITGFHQVRHEVKKHATSPSTYTFRKKLTDAVNAITSFSSKPLTYIFYVGSFILTVTAPYLAWLVSRRVFFEKSLEGWTSLIVSIWFLGGLNAFMLGIVAVYLGKVFSESKDRPYTLIRQTWERPHATRERVGPALASEPGRDE